MFIYLWLWLEVRSSELDEGKANVSRDFILFFLERCPPMDK